MLKFLLVPAETILPVDQLSAKTLARLKKALELFFAGGYARIVVCGGICNSRDCQRCAAAELMRQWLADNGVRRDLIIEEINSRDTFENVKFSLEELKKLGYNLNELQLTIVSQWQHCFRIAVSLRAFGFKEFKFEPVNYWLSPIGYLKEFLFIIYHLIDPKGEKGFAKRNRQRRHFTA